MLRRLVLVAVLHGAAGADDSAQIEGELFAPTDVAFIIGPPAELTWALEWKETEARSAKFAAAVERTSHPLARAQLHLARAELWAARAVAEKQAVLLDLDAGHELDAADATTRALAAYRDLWRLDLQGWRSRDRALASEAFLLGLARRPEAASVYRRLLTDFPDSPHTTRAHVALGDAALGARQLASAIEHYDKVAWSPHAATSLRVYALYKAAWIALDDRGDAKHAFMLFSRALTLDPKSSLAWELHRGVAKSFALFGAPADAHAAFAAAAPDDVLFMLEDLAIRWVANARYADAFPIYAELVRRAPHDARACGWQREAATMQLHLKNDVLYAAQAERLVRIFERARHFPDSGDCEDAVTRITLLEARSSEVPALRRRLFDLFVRAFPDQAHEVMR